MSALSVNGNGVGGEILKLNKGVSPANLYEKIKKDGRDQVFFECDGENYVAVGDKLNLSKIKPGYLGKLDGKDAHIQLVNDELTSYGEYFKKKAMMEKKREESTCYPSVSVRLIPCCLPRFL